MGEVIVEVGEKSLELPIASALGRPENTYDVIGVYGQSGWGKTAWVEEVLLKNKERLVIIDTNCHDYGNPEFCKAVGINYDAIIHNVTDAVPYYRKEKFRIILRVPGNEMNALNVFVSQNNRSDPALVTDCTIVVDELHKFMDKDNIPEQIDDIATVGRHSRLDFVGIAHVPKGQTNILYRSMLTMIVSFRQIEKGAIDFFRDFDDVKAANLKNLELGHYELFVADHDRFKKFLEKR